MFGRVLAAAICAVAMCCSAAQGQSDSSVPPPPAHPATAEQITKMMTITHAVDRTRVGMHKMIQEQRKSVAYLPDGFWTDLEIEMNKIDWIAVAIPVYQRYLSQEDADKAIAFYSTDAGQRSLDSSIAVMQEMSTKGFELGKAAGERVAQKYKTEIEENVRKMQSTPGATPAASNSK